MREMNGGIQYVSTYSGTYIYDTLCVLNLHMNMYMHEFSSNSTYKTRDNSTIV